MRLRFLTSTPLGIRQGSGTYAGIRTLADALAALGVGVEIEAPSFRLPVYTAQRLLFNEMLRWRRSGSFDATVGFDLDGYRVTGRGPHMASIKGVIADELRFQKGATWLTMALQARCERLHAQRADRVITTSHYAAGRIREFYGVDAAVVPELIDLAAWRALLAAHSAVPDPARFTVLCVCRLYRRKRVDVLLRAAARLGDALPGLQIRVVGDGPEREEFHRAGREARLGARVAWLGDIPRSRLAEEYNRCDVFCLPSVQEGFGIVFLEAMAAARPVVAAKAAAAPEVVGQAASLVEPDSPDALAEALLALERDPGRRACLAAAGAARVEQFNAPRVARLFLEEIRGLTGKAA